MVSKNFFYDWSDLDRQDTQQKIVVKWEECIHLLIILKPKKMFASSK